MAHLLIFSRISYSMIYFEIMLIFKVKWTINLLKGVGGLPQNRSVVMIILKGGSRSNFFFFFAKKFLPFPLYCLFRKKRKHFLRFTCKTKQFNTLFEKLYGASHSFCIAVLSGLSLCWQCICSGPRNRTWWAFARRWGGCGLFCCCWHGEPCASTWGFHKQRLCWHFEE